jgi:hypothetical protein
MLDSMSEEPGPFAAATCSRRSCLTTHHMIGTWAAQSHWHRVLQCAVASNSLPYNHTENVCTVCSLAAEPRPLFSSACNLCSSSPTTRITCINSSSLTCLSAAISVLHLRLSHSTLKTFSIQRTMFCGQGVPYVGVFPLLPATRLCIEMCKID